MRIWIFNHHALTPQQAGGTRHFDYAKKLVERGHEVTIFASSFHYASHTDFKTYPPDTDVLSERYDGVEFVWIRTRPYHGNGIGRVVNMLDYMRKAERIAKVRQDVPDIVIGSSVHLFAVLAAWRTAKRLCVPFVMEVRDLWPQTLIDMGMSRYHPFIVGMGMLERYLYRRADAVVTNLPYASRYIERYVPPEKIHWIPNGVDVERNRHIEAHRFEPNFFHVVYAGAIGLANQIDTLLDAAKLLADLPVRFHIVGDGPQRERLQNAAKISGLSSIRFYGPMEKSKAVAMINGADVLFFPLADSPVFRYGIASNKLFDYLASGRPILFASNAANNPVKDAGAGLSVPAGDAEAVAHALEELFRMSEAVRRDLGKKGLAHVRAFYAIEKLAEDLETLLHSIRYNFENSEKRVRLC